MLSFLVLWPLANLDLELNSCHLLLPASSSLVALIFLNLGFASSAGFSAASRFFWASSGLILAAAEMTPGAGFDGGGVADGAAKGVVLWTGVPSALRFWAIGRISLERSCSIVS